MLRHHIQEALKQSMKEGDKTRLAALRLIQSELKNKDIEVRGAGKTQASEEDILAVLQKMLKQRQESLSIYEKAGREDLAMTERGEIQIIHSFLPAQMSEEEVRSAISGVISEMGASSMKDMGKVIARLKEKFAGQMDFGKASGLIKESLSA